MKKLTFGLLVLTLSLCTMSSAHAVRLVSLMNVGSGHIVDKIVPLTPVVSRHENYRTQLEECRLETERLDDELAREWEFYWQTERREYDLRRAGVECRYERDLLLVDLEECRENREAEISNGDESSSSTESGYTEDDASSLLSENWYVLIDYLFNGTCDEPRHDQMRDRCLDECHAEQRELAESLENIRQSNRDVRRAIEDRIEWCWQDVERLEGELDVCLGGYPEDDSDENSHDSVDSTVTVDTPGANCGSVHCS